MPSPRSVLAISLTLAALLGCAAHDPLANRSLVSIEVTHDGQPMQLVGREIPVGSPSPAHLSLRFFANGGFGSSGGCNFFMGESYMVDRGVLSVRGGDSSTIIGCSVSLAQQDEWFAKFLQSAPAIGYAGDQVILSGTGIATVKLHGALLPFDATGIVVTMVDGTWP